MVSLYVTLSKFTSNAVALRRGTLQVLLYQTNSAIVKKDDLHTKWTHDKSKVVPNATSNGIVLIYLNPMFRGYRNQPID